MDLKTCYDNINADYNDVMSRLHNEKLLHKVLILFLTDNNFETLENALEKSDWETAFRAAHTLKGIVLNLSLTPLAVSASSLTEILRGGTPKEDWHDTFDQTVFRFRSAKRNGSIGNLKKISRDNFHHFAGHNHACYGRL